MCSMQMYYMHTHYEDKVPGSMHSRVFLSSLQSGGRGRGGGNSRRSVSDGSPDLTGSFTSDFIQPHAATLHMVKLSQTHTYALPHTASLSHTGDVHVSLKLNQEMAFILNSNKKKVQGDRGRDVWLAAENLCHCCLGSRFPAGNIWIVEMNKVCLSLPHTANPGFPEPL